MNHYFILNPAVEFFTENRRAGRFERLHDELGGGSWLIGRVTGSEYAKAQAYPDHTDQTCPRQPWFARRRAKAYGIALDAKGKIAWGRSDIGGDPIVAVLTERVSDAHLAGLRRDGVSYIFAGERELDLGLALQILNRELGLEHLLLEAGGGSNAAFLRAGLIDGSAWRSAPQSMEQTAPRASSTLATRRRRGTDPLNDAGQHIGLAAHKSCDPRRALPGRLADPGRGGRMGPICHALAAILGA